MKMYLVPVYVMKYKSYVVHIWKRINERLTAIHQLLHERKSVIAYLEIISHCGQIDQIDHDLDIIQDLHTTDPTQEIRTRSCKLHGWIPSGNMS